MTDASHVVYLLWDPRNGEIRYVGKTCHLRKRLWRHQHAMKTNGHCLSWERSLLQDGLCCEWAIVEDGLSSPAANEKECWWIAYGRQLGWRLTNLTDGGEGMPNPAPETREKLRKGSLGRVWSPESKDKNREAHLGLKQSQEAVEKWRRSFGRRTIPIEMRKRISQSLIGHKASPEARANISRAATLREAKKRQMKAESNNA